MRRILYTLFLAAMLSAFAVPAAAQTAEEPAAEQTQTAEGEETREGWDGDSYYVNGEMLKKTLKKIDGAYYYFDKNGKLVKDSFMKVSGSYYSFGTDGKAAVKKLQTIKGKKYYFGKSGAALKNQFKKVKDGKKKYTFYFGKSGAAYTAPEDKYAVTIKAFKINKKYYGFDENAHMVTGLWVVNGAKKDTVYSFSKTGANNAKVSKKLTKLVKYGKKSKSMYKDVLKAFGKPKKIRKSDGCNVFAGGSEKDYTDYNFRYPHMEVCISKYRRTGVYMMFGAYTYEEK